MYASFKFCLLENSPIIKLSFSIHTSVIRLVVIVHNQKNMFLNIEYCKRHIDKGVIDSAICVI
jgi:hypothetical protein